MSKKIRVLVNAIPLTNVHTGIARYLRCLYRQMEKDYAESIDFCYFDGRKLCKSLPKGMRNPKTRFKLVDLYRKMPAQAACLLRLLFYLRVEKRFFQLARGFDIYHEAGYFPFKAPSSLSTVFTVHDLSLFRFPKHHPQEKVLFNKMLWKSRYQQVDHFLAVSEFTKSELKTYLGIEDTRITVTHLAADNTKFRPGAPAQVHKLIRELELPKHFFLFVGSNNPGKNMHIIPEALQVADLDIPLVLAGGCNRSKAGLSAYVFPLEYITDEQLALLYSQALALVFPSQYEGFGLPVLEAMSCGCPVLTANKASLFEVAGQAAYYLLDTSNRAELGALLREVAANKEKRQCMINRGFKRAAQFSWERSAQLTSQVFWDLQNSGV